jgi:hypothetical protein
LVAMWWCLLFGGLWLAVVMVGVAFGVVGENIPR